MAKQLSNPFSTGGGGAHFEAHIIANFVVLMLTGGHAPCLPTWPIKEIKPQGKIDGYDTDDLIVLIENPETHKRKKLLGQVKHSMAFTEGNEVFAEVLLAAWSDFNNPAVFTKGQDVIALITGPISATDQNNVQWLLHHAKQTKDSNEFYRDVKTAKFSPSQAGKKLDVFRQHLKTANNNTDLSGEELYEFLNHFYVLAYDIGGETGVVLPLLHSHISQFHERYPKMIWGRIVDFVQTSNQHAATIAVANIPEDIVEVFSKKVEPTHIPQELLYETLVPEINCWTTHQYRSDLSLISLLGSWNEKNSKDVEVVSEFLNQDYSEWLSKARIILHEENPALSLKNGVWTVISKEQILKSIGSQFFDSDLERFRRIVEKVFAKDDPALELPKEERYAATIYGKEMEYSNSLQNGCAEGLAILGCNHEVFSNCSTNKAQEVASLAVRSLLHQKQWKHWATINRILPNLSEAAPNIFMSELEDALFKEPDLFEQLFAQESSGVSGTNYITGLLWALEGLAWDEEYIVRVILVLGFLASKDPGGNWSNRPDSSIVTILLPWNPQTLACLDKRKTAIRTLLQDMPDIGWKVIVQLLPNQQSTSFGSHKPKWRQQIPDDINEDINQKDYWDFSKFCSELAVESSFPDVGKISELIDAFDHLTKTAFDAFIKKLSSNEVASLPNEQKKIIWDKLLKLSNKHRKFSDAKWALSEDLLSRIEKVADSLSPEDPFLKNQFLFSGNDFELYDEKGDWEGQRKSLLSKREKAIQDVLSHYGIQAIIDFAKDVSSSRDVGTALAGVSNQDIDLELLPQKLLLTDTKMTEFISAYIWKRRYIEGWKWVDNLIGETWTEEEIGQFLAYLPFEKESWIRVDGLLGKHEAEYWLRTSANAYQTEDALDEAIKKLLEFNRPAAALDCFGRLRVDSREINRDLCSQALLMAVNTKESPHYLDQHNIVELIKFLQLNLDLQNDVLFKVEWAYLPLLNSYHDAKPIFLETKLSLEPNFFCELIQLVYRSKNDERENVHISEEKKAIANNSWKLLKEWSTPPGTQVDGVFNPNLFEQWFDYVNEKCAASGHLEVAHIHLGEVLIHSPKDIGGLWIDQTVAKALNSLGSEDVRQGFSTGLFNSRGVHTVDPAGKPERLIADQYREKASAVEEAGFSRLATTLRDLALSYDKYANKIACEHS
ncbi:hypothetical protein [Thiomicrorhabdus indica]|uniref:hypothetical protein n=1 Tax=Thiomicrorhabdus indica TaxID=2267253 RepID=UPI002AA7F42C|nr:hypothetical protein [Thiomicrorhabdus indica]